jgi:hypothetical protein
MALLQNLESDLRNRETRGGPRLPRNRRRHDIWNAHIEV